MVIGRASIGYGKDLWYTRSRLSDEGSCSLFGAIWIAETIIMEIQKALIVDDSRTAQVKLQRLLRPYPLEIVKADSAEEALLYLESQNPDVIFMDHSMPGMDGLEALKIIRSNPETAAIPVIMYTGQKGDVYVGRAQAAGANDVLSKDVMDDQSLGKMLRFLRLAPVPRPAKRQNITAISSRLAERSVRRDESMTIARALSGKASPSNLDMGEETAAEETISAAPAAQEANDATPLKGDTTEAPQEAPAEVAASDQEELPKESERVSRFIQEKEPSRYYSAPQYSAPPPQRVAESDHSKPIWPSLVIIGLLLFIAFQLAEIRSDQNELDRMVREIQIRMELN